MKRPKKKSWSYKNLVKFNSFIFFFVWFGSVFFRKINIPISFATLLRKKKTNKFNSTISTEIGFVFVCFVCIFKHLFPETIVLVINKNPKRKKSEIKSLSDQRRKNHQNFRESFPVKKSFQEIFQFPENFPIQKVCSDFRF